MDDKAVTEHFCCSCTVYSGSQGGYDVDGSSACPHKPLRTGVAATVESLLDVAEGREAPAVRSCGEVRDSTKQVVDQVLARNGLH